MTVALIAQLCFRRTDLRCTAVQKLAATELRERQLHLSLLTGCFPFLPLPVFGTCSAPHEQSR